ncbi:MAG: hypothetical protein ACXW2U_05510 [Telluria sp.]
MSLRHALSQVLTMLSQLFNLLCNPFSENTLAHETFSARCGRLGERKPYIFWRVVVDAMARPFDGPNHCQRAHEKLRSRYEPKP